MRTLPLLSAVVLTLSIVGCKPSSPAASDTPAPTAEDSQATAPAANGETPGVDTTKPGLAPGSLLGVDPSEMRECDKRGVVATVSWDVSSVAGVKVIEIWMSPPNGEPKVFRRGHAQGDTKTGSWAHPGMTFYLRNTADGSEIAKTQIKSVPCE